MPFTVFVDKDLSASVTEEWHEREARDLAVFDTTRGVEGCHRTLRCEVDTEYEHQAMAIARVRAQLIIDRGAWKDPAATRALWPEFAA